jgi:hypothetical protein
MKKYYSLCVVVFVNLLTLSVYADEWLDIAQDVQKHIATEIRI